MMTTRELLNTVINANLSDEVTEKAQALLLQLDKRNEKRASTPSKTAIANEPIKAKIFTLLSDGNKIASEVATNLEITPQKASALLRQLVESGVLYSEDVKIPKKGKVKSYGIAEGAQYLPHEVEA